MTSSLIIFLIALVLLFALFWVARRRKRGKVFGSYEGLLERWDPQVKKATFRSVRKIVVFKDSILRTLQKWSIAIAHLFLEIVHFISARFNKRLVKMKYKARKKVREIKTQEPSEFLRQVKEEREEK